MKKTTINETENVSQEMNESQFRDITKRNGRIILLSEAVVSTGCLPTRIVLWKNGNSGFNGRTEFVSHLACLRDGNYFNVQGHYMYDLEEAIEDYLDRCIRYSANPDGMKGLAGGE